MAISIQTLVPARPRVRAWRTKWTVALTASAWSKIVQTTALAPTANGSRVAMRGMCVTWLEWEDSQARYLSGSPLPHAAAPVQWPPGACVTPICRSKLLQQTETPQAQVETWLQRALDVARRPEARSLELRAAMRLSRLWHQQGKWKGARPAG